VSATGSYYAGSCFATADEARAAQCAKAYPVQEMVSGDLIAFSCSGVDAGVGLLLERTSSAASAASAAIATAYAPCSVGAIDSALITPDLAAQAFGAGFVLVVGIYVFAWGMAQIIEQFSDRWS
jgi:hypothetical protein